jgi:hypothetical protein
VIRSPRSFDRFGGYQAVEQGKLVLRLDIVRGKQTIVSRIHVAHARRCCEAAEIRHALETMSAPTFPKPAA